MAKCFSTDCGVFEWETLTKFCFVFMNFHKTEEKLHFMPYISLFLGKRKHIWNVFLRRSKNRWSFKQ